MVKLLENGISNINLKSGIVRALAVPEARGKANATLFREFFNSSNMLCKWAIGNTIEVIITRKDLEDVIKIVEDNSHGMSRQMFALALGKVPSEEGEKTLIKALDDEEIAPHALDALGKLKSQKAYPRIKELTSHPKPLIRKEAKKALKKIGRVQ